MVVVCSVCREVVHVAAGFILRHGVRRHGAFVACAASGTAYCAIEDGCCS